MHYSHDGSQYSSSADYRELTPCQGNYPGHKIVFLHRDPRDAVVSGFFQKSLRLNAGYEGSLSTFLRDPCLGIEKIIVFNLAWLETGPSLDIPFASIGYEQLREAPLLGLDRLFTWLVPDHAPDQADLQSVVEQSSFTAMQKQEREGSFAGKYGWMLQPTDPANRESYKVRRGVIGGFADYFSAEDVAFADDLLATYQYRERLQSCKANALL